MSMIFTLVRFIMCILRFKTADNPVCLSKILIGSILRSNK